MPEVIYELTLKDHMSHALHGISEQAEKLHHHFEGLGRILEGFGVSFLAFEGIAFIKESIKEVHTLNQAISQVKAGLKSTGEEAGVSFNEISEQAEKFAHSFTFTRGAIMDMQAQLITFPKVAGENFEKASAAIIDMSTRTHRGLNEVAIMVGKALQDPEKGITAMRRVGVNFDKEATERIKTMVEMGQVGKAQTAILKELMTEFGGSAQAAADADPLFRYNKSMEELKEIVGQAATEILHELTPALEAMVEDLKEAVKWTKANWDMIKLIGEAVLSAWAAYKLIGGAIAIMEAIKIATAGATTAAALFDAALASTAITVGGLAIVIGELVAVYKLLEEQTNRTNDAMNRIDKNDVDYEKGKYEGNEKHYKEHGMNEKQARAAAMNDLKRDKENYTRYISELSEEMNKLKVEKEHAPNMQIKREIDEKLFKAGVQIGSYKSLLKGADESITEHSLMPHKKGEAVGKKEEKEAKTKATGSKSVTINVTIKDLIGTQNINTTNLKEGAGKIKEIVTEALTGATNDFQIVAAR